MTYQDSSDEDLVRAVNAGHQEAFASLMERHKAALHGLILRQVQDKTVAEEICQESFIKAYLGLKKFRFASSFSTWLTRIGLNQVNSYFSSRKFKETKAQESFDPAKHEQVSEPSSGAFENPRVQQFRHALWKLKPKFRDVIILCGIEGKSYEEAAQILEVPIGTIRSRLNSSRLMIRDLLSNEFAFESEHEA